MDIVTVTLLVGLGTLLIERCFSWANKITNSECCGSKISFNEKNVY